ncbi:unnamed protein product [Effrenium voratum]|nr:unnamed protein product [Effrenium voratum]
MNREPSALERFEERRRSWAQMRQRGLLGLESKIGDQVHQEENREERLRRQDENQKAELKRLSMEDLAQRLPSLPGEPWQFGARGPRGEGDVWGVWAVCGVGCVWDPCGLVFSQK